MLGDPPKPTWKSIRERGDRARRAAEEGAFRQALARHDWSMTRAAMALMVDVETLSRYLVRRHPALCRERRRMAKRRA